VGGTRRIVLAIVCAAGIANLGCHHAADRTRAEIKATAGADSLQGTVTIVGVDAFPKAMLTLDDGGPALTLIGADALRSVAGLRIAVVGVRLGAQFTVEKFAVVAANGVPAIDGTLVEDGGALFVVTPDGVRHRLVNPSAALRGVVGHRVWVSGPLDHPPVAYGIIG
jgi:hypothetical protein